MRYREREQYYSVAKVNINTTCRYLSRDNANDKENRRTRVYAYDIAYICNVLRRDIVEGSGKSRFYSFHATCLLYCIVEAS